MNTNRQRVIVVSNRLPVSLKRGGTLWHSKVTAGGLATAMNPILRGSDGMWIGWSGDSAETTDENRVAILKEWTEKHRYFAVDLDQETANGFYEDLNLDYSVRLRWYVEGDTELNALRAELGGHEAIELINLRGKVNAGIGKGLSFSENLENDMRRSVYSFISLDGDVEDNRRVLDKAIERREMFGMAFISEPDFEFQNFNSDELARILWEMALKEGAPAEDEERFLKLVATAKNGKELTKYERQALPKFQSLAKGKMWGERLLRFAKENPYCEREGEKELRPIIEAILLARHVIECDYYLGREESRVDVKTRKIVSVKKYFAHGSNLLKVRLCERVPSALVRAVGYLPAYTVRYNKRSEDGSGKCNLVRSTENDRVYGVVYDFLDEEKPSLDKHEGLGRGYHTEEIRVITEDGETGAYTYVADDSAVDDSLKPYTWGKNRTTSGIAGCFCPL